MTTTTIDQLSIIQDVPLVLNVEFSENDFYEFCQLNRELRIERDANGTIHIMTPTGFETGNFNHEVTVELGIWNRSAKLGKVGDSSTGYTLPNGAVRSPDASWVSNERLAGLTPAQLEKFPPVCPDFVIEIRSPGDAMAKLKDKMREYMDNGCRLGWLIDRSREQVFIFRANGTVSLLERFDQPVSGEEVLPGFEVVLAELL